MAVKGVIIRTVTRFQIIGTRDQLRDNSGGVLSGGSVLVRAAGTVRLAETFSDAIGANPNPNPVPVSGSGRCNIWVDQPVDIVVRDAGGTPVYTESNLNPANVVGGFDSGRIANGGFELDSNSDGVPDGWTSENNATGSSNGLESGTSANIASGVQSWRTQSSGSGGGELVTDRFDVNDVDNIIVRFRHRSTVASVRNIVRVEWSDVTDTPISNTVILDSTTNPATFTETVATATPPSGARLARVRLLGGIAPGTLAGITYWDSFRVETPTVVTGAFGNLLLSGNTLSSTNTNGGIDLDPNGTGPINLRAATNIIGNTAITGTASVSGALSPASLVVGGTASVGGALSALDTLAVTGDTTLSTVTVSSIAQITSFLRANSNDTVDLTGDSSPLTIAPTSGQHLELDGQVLQSKATATTIGALQINTLGGQVEIGGVGATQDVLLRNLRTVVDGNQASPLFLQNRSDGAPAVGATQDIFLSLATSAGTDVAQIGFQNSSSMVVRSLNHGGSVFIQGEDAGGTVQTIFRGDPDGNSQMAHAGTTNIQTRSHTEAGAITGGQVRKRDGLLADIGTAAMVVEFISANVTLDESDVNKIIRRTAAGAWTITFPDDANIPQGAHGLIFNRRSAETVTITPASGVTVAGADGASVASLPANTLARWIKLRSSPTEYLLYTVS